MTKAGPGSGQEIEAPDRAQHVTEAYTQILDALGPVAALDVSRLGPYLAQASGTRVKNARGVPLYEQHGAVAVVAVEGPLVRKAWAWADEVWLDGYDRITQAMTAAATAPEIGAAVMRIDSPGGTAIGLPETFRALHKTFSAADKPIFAFIDETAASAAYFLALLADEIIIPPEGGVGSIGTYTSHYDMSRAIDRSGVTITRIQDPAGKTAGDVIRPLDDEAKTQIQARVSALSNTFYEAVAMRRGITVDAVRGLNARVLYGHEAIAAKLADSVGSWENALGKAAVAAKQRETKRMSDLYSLLGIPRDASAEDIKKATEEARPILALGRKALEMSGEQSADAATGVIASWKKDAAETATLHAEFATQKQETNAKERTQLLISLAQVEPPALVWKDPRNTAEGPVQELAEMSTLALRAYVSRRTKASVPKALRQNEPVTSGSEPSEADVKAYAKRNGIKNLEIAKAAMMKAAEGSV